MVFGGNTYGIMGFFHGSNRTDGFMKKTPKTPSEEIRKAEQLRAEHIRRHRRA